MSDTPRADAAFSQIGTHEAAFYAQPMTNLACQLEREINGWRRIGELYSLMRSQLVEKEAWELQGGFQAAACGKPIDECRRIANYKLCAKCPTCSGQGCEDCDGAGYVALPALEWMKNGNVQFSLLPKDHPDYDPTVS